MRRGPTPADRFTIISNDWIRDTSLSWGARGLLAWLASHAAGYHVTEQVIVDASPAGRDAVRALLRELVAAGYLRREQHRHRTDGRFGRADYTLADPATVDGFPDNGPDLREQGVCAGQPVDGFPDNGALYREDQEEKTKSYAPSGARSSFEVIPGGTQMTSKARPTYRQGALLPMVVPDQPSQSVAADEAPAHSAQTLIAEWIDHCAVRPPGRVVGQVSRLLREMLVDDGLPYDAVRRGLATWAIKGMHPAALPSVVNEVANRRPDLAAAQRVATGQPSTADLRVAQGLALAAKYEALEAGSIRPIWAVGS